MLKDYIELGETMDIEVDGVSTKTKVQEVLDDDLFTVLQPTVKLVPVMVQPNEIVRFTFYRHNGVYSFQAELQERISRENLRLYLFKAVSEIEKKTKEIWLPFAGHTERNAQNVRGQHGGGRQILRV